MAEKQKDLHDYEVNGSSPERGHPQELDMTGERKHSIVVQEGAEL
jgi:hypothetical protein